MRCSLSPRATLTEGSLMKKILFTLTIALLARTRAGPREEGEKAEERAKADPMKRLETMKGEEFDRDFAQTMVEGRQKAVDMVEQALTRTQDAQLHSLFAKLLPVLKDHLKL